MLSGSAGSCIYCGYPAHSIHLFIYQLQLPLSSILWTLTTNWKVVYKFPKSHLWILIKITGKLFRIYRWLLWDLQVIFQDLQVILLKFKIYRWILWDLQETFRIYRWLVGFRGKIYIPLLWFNGRIYITLSRFTSDFQNLLAIAKQWEKRVHHKY